jgi:S-DNA-T family DNA segregation ATPase FtsK/SpoIIIE
VAELELRGSLEVLERLKQAAVEFARREERMTRSLEVRRAGIAWRRQAAVGGGEEANAAYLAEIAQVFDDHEARIREVARARAAHVQRYGALALRTLPMKAREVRGNWLANLQVQLRDAEKARDSALAAAASEAQNAAATLTEECRRLILIKREARKRLTGYPGYRKRMAANSVGVGDTPGEAEGMRLVSEALAEAEGLLAAFRQFLLPKIFQILPPPVAAVLCVLIGAGLAAAWHFDTTGCEIGGGAAAILLAATFAIHLFSKRQVELAAIGLAESVAKADRLYEAVRVGGTQAHEREQKAIEETYQAAHKEISGQWSNADIIEKVYQAKVRTKIEEQWPRMLAKIKEQETRRSATVAASRQARLSAASIELNSNSEKALQTSDEEESRWAREEQQEWADLTAQWRAEMEPIFAELRAIQQQGLSLFPDWSADWIDQWQGPRDFPSGAKFADLEVDVAKLAGALPKDARLALPGPGKFLLPLTLSFPGQGSLLIEGKESGQTAALDALNALVLRLLAGSPPGKVSFTIIDPVGLGQNFAGLMYLADYEESLINRRIWTQQSQIEERLAELNEHIEKVIQMYLRNEYATITEYNEKAGSVAEKYHFLVIADFPAQFSETAARRLQSIATSGPRCGVFTLVQWDQRQSPPEGLAIEELHRGSVVAQRKGDGYFLPGLQPDGTRLLLASPPDAELSARLVQKTGKASVDSNRVEVPFSQIAPAPGELWTGDTSQEVKVAIGRSGATKPQYLAIGKGTRQHALFAGKTGSGKSTLFHVIITNLALHCSPREVEFYLIDFKKGVEFKCYAEKRLPHARVVAIESDREFALSVLQRVDEELRRRGDLYRKLGVQDVAGYRRAGGGELPRTLLIIDEFQEFFVEDDAIAQTASLLFDRIVRQGRAFGIHVLLGSQTLGGAYTLARATLGQMVIRVALQCNEADAYLIMDDNNSAPRLLSRPGEGIYNDAAGAVEGNSPFQVVWLSDEERDRLLEQVHALAEERGIKTAGPIVFEGNAPADVHDNATLRELLATVPGEVPEVGRMWLGAPNSIKGPTEAVFHRQSGNNLLVVGQREESALSILGLGLLALGSQYPAGAARFVFLQGATDGAAPAFIEAIAKSLPHDVTIVGPHDAAAAIGEASAELKRRMSSGAYGAGPLYLFINGLQKFKKLRHEEDFSFSISEGDGEADPGAQFDELIREGAAYGVHLLITVDAYSNVTRFISRKAMSEFEMRVVFQMSANDSASLIDSPNASNLGLHRALFFNEREGTLETFRPYALPEQDWVEEAAAKLATRAKKKATTAPAKA